MQVRQRYTKEFKLEAVRQLEEGIKPAAVVARELGVRRNQLYKWKNEVADKGSEAAFKDPGRRLASAGGVDETAALKYVFVQTQIPHHPITLLCHVLKVSQSGY